ncbi:amylo-alpha-1,6-glucosidase [Jeotgalibacillus haloalkalitolerans]|uniref:Amylo-alpha-1,6-glucosidase n=1 Tax=Jeotgalibacillus haloalkalitolerans TaxID=3104292 RepID=A0ABU5KN92_9BACL|nr:amylo-alpha-1,6-glucosidase [Jeotgalibacillus sp. HH7-29]MDZ5712730.1 amylo-alpha-1,6-glucosidase [Jeotgalibacillus sp. HH7-29]
MNYRVIKENDLFLLTDEKGDITPNHTYELGLYTKDTRFLSEFKLLINGESPIPLHSDGGENYRSTILLTNPHQEKDGELILWRESIQFERTRFIHNDVLYETVKATSYFPKEVSFNIGLQSDADFTDMFIVRGFQNGETGTKAPVTSEPGKITFSYNGIDQIDRKTVISWDQPEKQVEGGSVTFNWTLQHGESKEVTFTVEALHQETTGVAADRQSAMQALQDSYKVWNESLPKVQSNHQQLNRLIQRGTDDLRVLLTDVGFGSFPVAGLPWFGVPFGRDSLIAALQLLPFNAEVAKGTLRTMAHYQGTKVDAWRDEQPGKIMHEIRYGELANTNQIPFAPYYGSVDSTPLFLMLLVETINWTGDLTLAEELKPNIDRALNWIDEYGDRDGDLFVEYHQEASKGIANQGWKDSGDSIVHRNGDYANSPIALSEVQGYVYQAKTGIATLFEALGDSGRADQLRAEAERLKEKFNQDFWMEDIGYYAIALDEHKKQVGTITSNPGHVLQSGILTEERARKVSAHLTEEKMFSGYGIRTMAEGEAGYNPMSYHDGSVWPHDNSMILLGMGKLGHHTEMNKVIGGLIEASRHFEYDRLPELFCGYDESLKKAVPYPVACSPQAWAAGTPLSFIQSLLGIFPDSLNKNIVINPVLLESMDELQVNDMKVGEGVLSLEVRRINGKVDVKVLNNTTGFEVVSQQLTKHFN